MTDQTPQAGGPLTVADVLALPVMAVGVPPASFLKGGELVLTTGLPLPTQPP